MYWYLQCNMLFQNQVGHCWYTSCKHGGRLDSAWLRLLYSTARSSQNWKSRLVILTISYSIFVLLESDWKKMRSRKVPHQGWKNSGIQLFMKTNFREAARCLTRKKKQLIRFNSMTELNLLKTNAIWFKIYNNKRLLELI